MNLLAISQIGTPERERVEKTRLEREYNTSKMKYIAHSVKTRGILWLSELRFVLESNCRIMLRVQSDFFSGKKVKAA